MKLLEEGEVLLDRTMRDKQTKIKFVTDSILEVERNIEGF